MLITPTQSNVLASLRAFLLAVLPDGMEVVTGGPNRVPEPKVGGFVVMSPVRINRLATNLDTASDVVFEGSIAGTVLSVTEMLHGTIRTGLNLFGLDVLEATKISSQLSGSTGGSGTYQVSKTQTIGARKLAAGYWSMQQNAEHTVQLDFHGDTIAASDNAQIVATAFRDLYGCDFFRQLASPLNGVSPLHADDPRQMPFINDEQQYEWRWILEACLQANQVVITPQQFAEALEIGLIEVDSHYPP